jgi:hypothetical protein
MTLTTALALLGGVLLLVLLVHGLWNTRRAAARRPAPGGPGAPGERIEPALGAEPRADADAASADGPDTVPMPAPVRASPWRLVRLDPLIDAIVPLVPEAPVSGEAAIAHLPPTRRVGSKPFYVEGLDDETGTWEPLAAGCRYRELQAGVQLASRSGALNEIEYSEFVHKAEALAEAIGARAEPPDMLEVAARARELDGLAGPLDATLTITLRANAVAWSVGYVQQAAARLGFVPGAVPGRFVLPAAEEGAPPLLVLAVPAQAALAEDPSTAAVRECTLSLDVPQVPAAAEPFPAFHRTATTLADELDATPVDDQGQPVTLHAYDVIGKELERLYVELEKLDLAAGSPAARRLFS